MLMTDEEFVKDLLRAPDAVIQFSPDHEDSTGRVLEIRAVRSNREFDGLRFSDLVRLTQHFGCSECDMSTAHQGGCETCDWGSTHTITLRLWKFSYLSFKEADSP